MRCEVLLITFRTLESNTHQSVKSGDKFITQPISDKNLNPGLANHVISKAGLTQLVYFST